VSSIALEVQNLEKSYRAKKAVRGVSFTAKFGQVTAVLGPNGAGKTTTIECCEGLREPDGGDIKILGENPATAPASVKARIGVMLQDGGLPMAAPAGSVLRHVGRLYGDRSRQRETQLIEQLELGEHLKTTVRRLSGGNRQRLALACALIGDPEVLFLDEPTAGMDAYARVAVHNLIKEIKSQGTAIVLTTHLLDEAEALADQVVLIANGKVEAAGTVAEVTASGREGIRLTVKNDDPKMPSASNAVDGLVPNLRTAMGEEYRVDATDADHIDISPGPSPEAFMRIAAALSEAHLQVHEIRQLTDLTSMFLDLAREGDDK